MRRLGGAEARFGRYFDEAEKLAVEGEFGVAEDKGALAVRGVAHFALWDWFNRMFGYERMDPFASFGARGWIGSRGQVGPAFGLGAFYYLSDDWALRFGYEFTLGLDTEVEGYHSVSVGLQYSFR